MPLKISGITRDPFRAKVCEPDAVELGAEGRTRHHESRLELTSAPTDDLRTWLSNEIELEASADRLHLLVRRSYNGRGRELVELTGEQLTEPTPIEHAAE